VTQPGATVQSAAPPLADAAPLEPPLSLLLHAAAMTVNTPRTAAILSSEPIFMRPPLSYPSRTRRVLPHPPRRCSRSVRHDHPTVAPYIRAPGPDRMEPRASDPRAA